MQALEKAAWHQPSFWSLFLLVPPSLYSFTNFCFHLVDWECFFLSLLFWGGVGACSVCACLAVCLCVGSRVCTCAETVAARYRLWHLFISSAQAGSLAEPRPHRLTPASTALGLSQGHASLPSMWVLWAWTPVLMLLWWERYPQNHLLNLHHSFQQISPLKFFLHQDATAISEH